MYTNDWKKQKESILDFVKNNKQLIISGNLTELYQKLKQGLVIPGHSLTGFFLDCSVDPLEFMESVPENFFWAKGYDYELIIPENIKSIGVSAFWGSKLKSITVKGNITDIGFGAFRDCDFSRLTFEGDVDNIDTYAFSSAAGLIICSQSVEDKILRSGGDQNLIKFKEL